MSTVLRGFGLCSALSESGGAAMRVSPIPHGDSIPRSLRRKIGNLSQLMFAAARNATDKCPLPPLFPMIVGTAFGEIDTGIDFLVELHDTRGAVLRPTWVQNCVHVSSSGYLGILLENQGTTMTISQGKLTPEASLDALITLLEWQQTPLGLMVVGDLFNPAWRERLSASDPDNPLFSSLFTENYYEGVAALIIGSETPADRDGKHWRIRGGVERLPEGDNESVQSALVTIVGSLPHNTEIVTRHYAPYRAPLPESWTNLANGQTTATILGTGFGTSMTGPFDYLAHRLPQTGADCILFLSREDDEIGYIRLDRLTDTTNDDQQID